MNLTINEQLMHDIKDANICIFIANLATWLRTNAKKDDPKHCNIHEGRCWSYNSMQEFVRYFGFWSTQNIRTIIANCIKLELITTSSFNKKKYDNTLWYTLTEKGLSYYPQLRELILNRLVDSNKGLVNSNKPIPENPYTLRDNNTNSEFHNSRSNSNLEKSDYSGNYDGEGFEGLETLDNTGDIAKSDYNNNQTLGGIQKDKIESRYRNADTNAHVNERYSKSPECLEILR